MPGHGATPPRPQPLLYLQKEAAEGANQAVANEVRRAQEEAQAAAAQTGSEASSSGTAVTQEDQAQLATQVEQVSQDRTTSTPPSTAFETALANDRVLFLIASRPSAKFDAGNGGTCELNAGDILLKDSIMEGTGLVTMKVKVAQPTSCKAGTLVTLTIPQLQSISCF